MATDSSIDSNRPSGSATKFDSADGTGDPTFRRRSDFVRIDSPAASQPEAENAQWLPSSLASYVEVPFRHKRTIITSVLLAMLVGWLAILVWPRQYESQAKLKIRVGRSSVALDPTVTTGQTMLMQKTVEEEVITTLDVLGSRQVLTKVVDKIGADAVLSGYVPGNGPAEEPSLLDRSKDAVSDTLHSVLYAVGLKDDVSNHELAVMRLDSQLHIYAPKKSSILTITGESKTPEMAKLMAETMISVFMKEHLRSSATPGSLKFFSTEVEQSEDQLAKLLQQRCDFLTTEKMVSVDAKRAMLSDKLVTLNRDILNAKANVQQTRAKIADLNLKIAAMDDEIVVSRNQLSSNTWSGIRQRVYDLEVAERNMSAIYKDSHPTLINTQEQLQSARDIMEKVKTDDVNENTAINPAKAKAEEELRLLQTSFVGLETEVKEKVHEQKLADTEVNQLLENERKLVDLNRNISVLESNLSLLNQKMEESRLIEELEREQFSNVSVVQPASLTQRPVSPKKPVLAMAFTMLGGLIGLFLAYAKNSTNESVQSAELLRQWVGGNRVVEIPPSTNPYGKKQDRERYRAILLDALRNSRSDGSATSGGQVIGVLGCNTGCGATTVARSLADVGRQEFFDDIGLLDWSDIRLVNDDKSFHQWDEKLSELSSANELVIVDLPPAQSLHQTQILDKIDQVVVVVESDSTTKVSAKRTVNLLAEDATPKLVSVVLNKSKRYMPRFLDQLLRPGTVA